MTLNNILMIAVACFAGHKIWQGSRSVSARACMYLFLIFILNLWLGPN